MRDPREAYGLIPTRGQDRQAAAGIGERGGRVVFVLPSFAGGGAERVVVTVAGALAQQGRDIHLIALSGAGPLASLAPAGLPVHVLERPRVRQALPTLIRTIRRLRPTVLVSTISQLNLAVAALRPVLPASMAVYLRETNTPSRNLANLPPFAGLLMRSGYRMLYPKATGVVCNAGIVAQELELDFLVEPARIHRIDNPVDIAGLRTRAQPGRRTPGPGARFVAAGRLTRQKGFDRLVECFARHSPDSHLTILGEGPDESALRRRIETLGLAKRISLAGFEPEPWREYAGADAFLLPSRWEGMPNAALEALACGTPVIATPEAGGISEVAEDAAPGAVTVAAWGEEFEAAMATVLAQPPSAEPRESLLPERFALESVIQCWAALLDRRSAAP
ncbi:MAG: glycosyltransferase [Proteobacteria bacterium]|nr:glycosyltransferase [Pseudomonadota bacterium]